MKYKEEIDGMDYEEMLRINRFGSSNTELRSGETGQYFIEQMTKKKEDLPAGEAVAVSKRIGWGE